MVKCYQHIGTISNEWCWKCQELTDNDRFNSNKIIELFKQEDIINKKAKEFDLANGVYAFEQGVKWQIDRSYSEEEVVSFIHKFIKEHQPQLPYLIGGINMWFGQYKKK